ncbi:NPCBM/NEW2 domain-containing protein, partial [Candidatus Gottesmanbacteria bacterium]|nr:NPCBM/NEW2 domain-containing protein [Candidatus Gottesmanbacteria bacterium]
YAPVFFLFLWQTTGFTGLVRAVLGAALGFIGLNIEFIAAKNSDRILASLTENYDYFPWMSLMAYNLWWIVSEARGLATSDKLTVLGMINAKTVGLLMFSSFYGFAALRQYIEGRITQLAKIRDAALIKLLLESLIVINAAFFLFQTQSHDRYAYPLTVFLLLWAPFVIADVKGKVVALKLKIFSSAYILFSLFYFYNLHTALVVNYPNNGLPLLSAAIGPLYTISAAYILLALFGLYVTSLLMTSRLTRRIALAVITVLAGSLLLLNKPLLTKQPVSLTAYTPFISEQAYGTRQTNKAVQSSFGGAYKWTRLSVQYLFYDKGIGTHANSRHVFDIKKHYRTFTADVGIDTEAGAKASAVFEVYGDNKLLFRSPVIKRYDLPHHIKTDITGVTHLTLITKDAGDGNYDDHTDWLNPMLLP